MALSLACLLAGVSRGVAGGGPLLVEGVWVRAGAHTQCVCVWVTGEGRPRARRCRLGPGVEPDVEPGVSFAGVSRGVVGAGPLLLEHPGPPGRLPSPRERRAQTAKLEMTV